MTAPRSLDGFDDLVVALRAARLDHAVTPASSASCGPSANGKNASEASEAPSGRGRAPPPSQGDAHRVDAAHLACADADRLQVLREHDRVRADVLAHPPREEQVAQHDSLGSPATSSIPRGPRLEVAVLDEQPAGDALVVLLGRRRRGAARGRGGCAVAASRSAPQRGLRRSRARTAPR